MYILLKITGFFLEKKNIQCDIKKKAFIKTILTLCGPHIFFAIMCFRLKTARLIFISLKNHLKKIVLELPLIFVFILIGKTK